MYREEGYDYGHGGKAQAPVSAPDTAAANGCGQLSDPSQLCEILKQSFGIDTYRTAIKSDIEILQKAGFEIDEHRSALNRHRFLGRDFEIAELKAIIDAISS